MKFKYLKLLLLLVISFSLVSLTSNASASVLTDHACPQLKANSNVIVICMNNNNSPNTSKVHFRCDNASIGNSGQIVVGTVAVYQCSKYFQPALKGLSSGRLQCTGNGVWTNYAAFKRFQCEIGCGKRPGFHNQLISSGNDTSAKHWPWVAAIYRQVGHGKFRYSCGGTLIGLRTVITVAHCLTDQYLNKYPTKHIKIVLGSISSDFDTNVAKGLTVHSVRDTFIHPDYDPESLTSDIGIIELANPVELSDTIFPICLPSSFEEDAITLSADNAGEIASFGIDNTGLPAKNLQYANISILSAASCYTRIGIIPKLEQFCAGNTNGANICRGDSGTGLVFKSHQYFEQEYIIRGILSSAGVLSNECSPIVLFEKVFSYLVWIQEKLITSENLERPAEIFHNRQIKEFQGTAVATNNCMNQKGLNKSTLEISNRRRTDCIDDDDDRITYNSEEKKALALLYPLVKDMLLENYMHSEAYLIKFLRARNLKLQDTVEMLRATMKWRKENRMHEITKENFTKFQNNFTVFFQGHDKDGRPVLAFILGLFNLRKVIETGDINQFRRYLFSILEETSERIRAVGKKNITQNVQIFDMAGVDRRKHLCLQCINVLVEYVSAYEKYYPQQNYLTYVINLRGIGSSINGQHWASGAEILDPFRLVVSQHTVKTIRMFGTKKEEWSKELLKQIPADQLFKVYGGTKSIKHGTMRAQLAL